MTLFRAMGPPAPPLTGAVLIGCASGLVARAAVVFRVLTGCSPQGCAVPPISGTGFSAGGGGTGMRWLGESWGWPAATGYPVVAEAK